MTMKFNGSVLNV